MKHPDEIELLPDNLGGLELTFKKIKLQEYLDNIAERRRYRRWMFLLALSWISVIALLFILIPLGESYLSKGVYTAIASTGTYSIFRL
jgi:hypothetical protein